MFSACNNKQHHCRAAPNIGDAHLTTQIFHNVSSWPNYERPNYEDGRAVWRLFTNRATVQRTPLFTNSRGPAAESRAVGNVYVQQWVTSLIALLMQVIALITDMFRQVTLPGTSCLACYILLQLIYTKFRRYILLGIDLMPLVCRRKP